MLTNKKTLIGAFLMEVKGDKCISKFILSDHEASAVCVTEYVNSFLFCANLPIYVTVHPPKLNMETQRGHFVLKWL